MDYKVVSQQVVDNVGGLENIEGATHCVTRLRLVLKDTSKYNKAELENIDGVKGVLYNSGQLMIIFGTGTVNKVYDEFMALTGVKEISASEVKGAEADKKGKFFSVLKVFSDIFIPIIPAFVGAAIIIGLKSLIVANGLFGMDLYPVRVFVKRPHRQLIMVVKSGAQRIGDVAGAPKQRVPGSEILFIFRHQPVEQFDRAVVHVDGLDTQELQG